IPRCSTRPEHTIVDGRSSPAMRTKARFAESRSPARERRVVARGLCSPRIIARVVREDATPEEWVMVRNLSTTGIGLVFRSAVAPGSTVQVRLHDPTGGTGCQLPVRIIHVIPHELGSFVAGGAIARALTSDERRALGARD